MARVGGDGLPTGLVHTLHDLVAVGGDDDAIGDLEGAHALEDADDDRDAGEEAQGLPGEARGAQPGRDDGEGAHGRRTRPRHSDALAKRAPDATFTPAKIGCGLGFRNSGVALDTLQRDPDAELAAALAGHRARILDAQHAQPDADPHLVLEVR